MTDPRTDALTVAEFPGWYRARMIAAYPVIAGMTKDEFYFSTLAERDEAFGRILACRNLRVTHEKFREEAVRDRMSAT